MDKTTLFLVVVNDRRDCHGYGGLPLRRRKIKTEKPHSDGYPWRKLR